MWEIAIAEVGKALHTRSNGAEVGFKRKLQACLGLSDSFAELELKT